jgi:hypothetical protein
MEANRALNVSALQRARLTPCAHKALASVNKSPERRAIAKQRTFYCPMQWPVHGQSVAGDTISPETRRGLGQSTAASLPRAQTVPRHVHEKFSCRPPDIRCSNYIGMAKPGGICHGVKAAFDFTARVARSRFSSLRSGPPLPLLDGARCANGVASTASRGSDSLRGGELRFTPSMTSKELEVLQ